MKGKLTPSLLVVFVVGPARGIANWSSLLFIGVVFVEVGGEDGSTIVVVAVGCGVGAGVLTSKMNFASGSFIVVESQTNPGVMFPSAVNEGSELRCRRKRNAMNASYDKFSIKENSSRIDGFVSSTAGVRGL